MAAVKACGPGALLSGRAGAPLFGLIKGPAPPPHVTARTERDVAGITTRRSPATCSNDATKFNGIAVTTIPRILVDLAGTLSFDALARACHEARVRYGTRPEHVDAVLARSGRPKGPRTPRAVLHGDAPTTLSAFEKGSPAPPKTHALQLPITNRPAGAHYVDCR